MKNPKRKSSQPKRKSTEIMPWFAFRYSFGRPIHGCFGTLKILRFATVLGVRRSLFALKVASRSWKLAFRYSFGHPTSTKSRRTYPARKKNRFLRRGSILEKQPFSAAFRLSRQLFSATFSATFLGSLSQQLSLAAFLSSLSQQLFSAAFLSSFTQQPFSAAFLSSLSQQLSQQLFSAAFLSGFSQQLFSAAILSYHLAVVRGWWSAINMILLWSGVGGQLLTSSCCGEGLVLSYEHVLWKNPFATLSGKNHQKK